jgi:hypothetical protein
MTSLIHMLRSRFDAEYSRQVFLAACQDFDDPALRERLVRAVDDAIASANVDQLDIDVDDAAVLHSVWWSWKREADTSAQRTVHAHGRTDHAIYVDGQRRDGGPWLVTLDAGVRFMPGRGFDTPTAFLDWFEEVQR